ncbi:bifunctional tetrahydrofolate synthase/dihydrofolate synthase [Stagnimonas aquatica]|uniref:Dihydrofolate synthase/folylpolyglutamate synthase n=1 Tax=Stagnimonas aquatica TaxID=2689987 RepID=A0A3N0UYP6_9GAMM|nr:bifunctional tetrahydrofolate synthase/dihydrofolate synthase [Stagnimonas aquatica]
MDDWLRYQERLHPASIELGLDRVAAVADRLQLRTAPATTLTVAGTNGKGSTTSLLALIYRQAGYRVGAYTSPHLYRYNERVMINGETASNEALCRAFRAVDQARAGESLTYFEFGTLAALWLFREAAVDVQVLEVGLGGRLDAVNILDADLALVTNIGLDHREWLGPDREAIGTEKAGVFRRGRPAVCVDVNPPRSLLRVAEDLNIPLLRLDRNDFGFRSDGAVWHWSGPGRQLHGLPLPGLAGAHQLLNAAGVIAAVETLQPKLPVREEAIRAALPALRLAGRLELRGDLLLDVAHNAEAAEVLAAHLASRYPGRRLQWLVGMLSDKPVERIAEILGPHLAQAWVFGLPPPRGLSASALSQRLNHAGLRATPCEDAASALAAARSQSAPGLPVLVCGSFLTIAALEGLL